MKKWMLRGFLCVALVLFASTLWAQGKSEIYNDHKVAAQEVLVKFQSPTLPAIGRALNAANADEVQGLGGAPGLFRFHSRAMNVDALVRLLSRFADVEYAEPNYILEAIVTPTDPYYSQLWGITKIGAPLAWGFTTGSRNNVVAVVDTGIDYNHPDLAANVWSAPPGGLIVTIGGTTIYCKGGTHGFNAITNTCDPMDDNAHGTHVSGTIGAVGNNGLGVVGVNWTASIMGLKFLDKSGSGTTANAVNAIEFAVQARQQAGVNVQVLSNSWGGGGFSQSLLNAINHANNMLFVAAAGNNGKNSDRKPFYPASYNAANIIAVAATDSKDILANWSNYGATSVDLAAPGVGIWSTVLGGTYASYSGTSMATPHVSGAAALVLAKCPALSTGTLKSSLLNTVDPVSSLAGKTVTGGRLNVNRAVTTCQ